MIKFKRLIKSFRYATKGLVKTFKEEQNLRIQSLAGLVVLLLGWYFGVNRVEFSLLILVIGMVILMEIANSALERVTDVLKPRLNTYVKEIKDIAAAAVMFSAMIAIGVGIIIFYPYIFN